MPFGVVLGLLPLGVSVENSPLSTSDGRVIVRIVWGHVALPGGRASSELAGQSWGMSVPRSGYLELHAGATVVARGELCLHDGQLALRIMQVCGALS
jgi:hypothetical protein